jgi:hypothetical protein
MGQGFSWWGDHMWLMVEPERSRGRHGVIAALFLRSDGDLIEAPASFFEVIGGE